ncbi:MAG: hypothetical protein H6Q17_1431 [Bacteroidetes bacterium]|nr:hypothetical protein [Bacteroidota bacterium]
MTVKDRLIKYIRLKDIPTSQFERMCGMSNGYINSIRKTLGIEKLDNVLKTFPDLNREWLLTGEGSMLRKESLKKIETIQSQDSNQIGTTSDINALKDKIYELQKEVSLLKNERSVLVSTNDRLTQMLENTINQILNSKL